MIIITIMYTYPAPGTASRTFSQLFPQQPYEADTHYHPYYSQGTEAQLLVLGQCVSHQSAHRR